MGRSKESWDYARYAKYTILLLGCIGFFCSLGALLSCSYFNVVIDLDNNANVPEPFHNAECASVGLFKYNLEGGNADGTETTEAEDGNVDEGQPFRQLKLLTNDQEQSGAEALDQGHLRMGDPTSRGKTCTQYEYGFHQFNKPFTLSQISSMIAPLSSFIAVFWVIIEFSCCYHKYSCIGVNFFFGIAVLTQLMTLLVFADDEICGSDGMVCKAGKGVTMSIFALLCYCACFCIEGMAPIALPCCLRVPPITEESDHDDDDDVDDDDDDTTNVAKQQDNDTQYGKKNRNIGPSKKGKKKSFRRTGSNETMRTGSSMRSSMRSSLRSHSQNLDTDKSFRGNNSNNNNKEIIVDTSISSTGTEDVGTVSGGPTTTTTTMDNNKKHRPQLGEQQQESSRRSRNYNRKNKIQNDSKKFNNSQNLDTADTSFRVNSKGKRDSKRFNNSQNLDTADNSFRVNSKGQRDSKRLSNSQNLDTADVSFRVDGKGQRDSKRLSNSQNLDTADASFRVNGKDWQQPLK